MKYVFRKALATFKCEKIFFQSGYTKYKQSKLLPMDGNMPVQIFG